MDESAKTSAGPPADPKPPRRLILVVDDHQAVLDAVKMLLESKGYEVAAARDGAAAVSLCRQHQGEIAAVITDLMMPEMNGVATVRALRELDPALKFIGISGAVDPSKIREFGSIDLVVLLQKPFSTDELMAALQQALRGEAS